MLRHSKVFYAEAGYIFGPADMKIYNLASQGVTAQNVQLSGVYVVCVGEQSAKVLVK